MKKLISAGLIIASLALSLCAFGTVSAQSSGQLQASDLGVVYGAYTGLGSKDVRVTIAQIIRTAMGLLGIVAVVIILIGGFTWMTAGGNDEKVAQAKKWIFAGIIGLIIIFSAYALSTFVLNKLVGATTGANPPGI